VTEVRDNPDARRFEIAAMSHSARTAILTGAGVAIVLLAFAAALLPLFEEAPARMTIGWLLLAAGLAELIAAAARFAHRPTSAIAGGATMLAGLRLLLDPEAGFFEVLNLVILWLVVRTAALGFCALKAHDRMKAWLGLAAAVDFLLAVALLAGMPVALLVVGLFGPTRQVSATFAWVIALSFVATAALQFAAAQLERPQQRREEPPPPPAA
jgi:uncharacterized membrane protein HdeD (DUF308 family)